MIILIQLIEKRRRYSVVWESSRIEKRAPLFWRMYQATKHIPMPPIIL